MVISNEGKCKYCNGELPESKIECGEVIPEGFCSIKCSKYYNRKMDSCSYLKQSGVPKRYLKCSFKNFIVNNEQIKKVVSDLKNITNVNDSILITGRAGCGKTHLAVALMREQSLKTIRRAWFYNVTEILIDLRSVYNKDGNSEKEMFEKFFTNDILIIDDIGAEKVSDYVVQSWYRIIDHRYSACLPTVYTTNLSMPEIGVRFGDRIASRLSAGMVFTIDGKDGRLV